MIDLRKQYTYIGFINVICYEYSEYCKMNEPEVSTYLSPDDVADRLGVTGAMIRRHCLQGTIKAYKVGSRWRIPPEEVHSFVKSNQVHDKESDS